MYFGKYMGRIISQAWSSRNQGEKVGVRDLEVRSGEFSFFVL